eukprot:11156316-Lingulodinium_polyedra.AAC.2
MGRKKQKQPERGRNGQKKRHTQTETRNNGRNGQTQTDTGKRGQQRPSARFCPGRPPGTLAETNACAFARASANCFNCVANTWIQQRKCLQNTRKTTNLTSKPWMRRLRAAPRPPGLPAAIGA